MVSSSDKAVCDYVNSLLLDVSFADIQVSDVNAYEPIDSVMSGQRLQVTDDVFARMSLTDKNSQTQLCLMVMSLLSLLRELPEES